MDWSAGLLMTRAGAGVTVNVFVQEVVSGAQVLVYTQVTVVNPPQAGGATGDAGMVVSTPLHPPLAVVVWSHVANEVLMAPWPWQAGSVLLMAQVKLTGGAAVMVKVALTYPDPHRSVTL